jgi:translocation and assembly module TamB
VYLDYPFGLRTVSKAAITLRQDGEPIVLGGAINIQEGSFRDPLTLEGNLLGMLNSSPDIGIAEERNPYLERMRFDVGIETDAPLLVNNNLAKAGLNLDLRLAGTYYQPSLLGRITLEEGGELYFAERSYAVERGAITFTSEQKIEPSFDILARTQTAGHDISLLISGGGAEKIQTTLTSEPPAQQAPTRGERRESRRARLQRPSAR